MRILSGTQIRERLERGEIFRRSTWDTACINGALYALRVARDGMLINDNSYPPGKEYPEPSIKIEPGAIAIPSTLERFDIPANLVGHPGVR